MTRKILSHKSHYEHNLFLKTCFNLVCTSLITNIYVYVEIKQHLNWSIRLKLPIRNQFFVSTHNSTQINQTVKTFKTQSGT
jgi:hypothetical protein